MDKSSFLTALAFLINLNKTHFLQDFIEEHVVYFILGWRWNTKKFNDCIILFDKFLSNVLLVI